MKMVHLKSGRNYLHTMPEQLQSSDAVRPTVQCHLPGKCVLNVYLSFLDMLTEYLQHCIDSLNITSIKSRNVVDSELIAINSYHSANQQHCTAQDLRHDSYIKSIISHSK